MHAHPALPLRSPAPALTTRRQFLGRGAATALALASAARVSAQATAPSKYSGLRIPETRFCPADGFVVLFTLTCGPTPPT